MRFFPGSRQANARHSRPPKGGRRRSPPSFPFLVNPSIRTIGCSPPLPPPFFSKRPTLSVDTVVTNPWLVRGVFPEEVSLPWKRRASFEEVPPFLPSSLGGLLAFFRGPRLSPFLRSSLMSFARAASFFSSDEPELSSADSLRRVFLSFPQAS